jgi:RNA polymerase sigma-70 factor (ECF subfamily)
MKTQTDSKLIFQYQNGDEKALSTLINRHKKDLFTFIYYKLMDEDLANDIFQDTFIKIIVTLKKVVTKKKTSSSFGQNVLHII